MKAIAATGKIDAQGQLSLDKPLEGAKPSSVRVIILLSETEEGTESNLEGEYQKRELIPIENLQRETKQALSEAGYDSREKIIELVQEVKQEIATERQKQKTT